MPQQHCAFTRRWQASKVFVNNLFLVAKPTNKSIVLEKSTTDLTGFYRLTSQISCENHHGMVCQKLRILCLHILSRNLSIVGKQQNIIIIGLYTFFSLISFISVYKNVN